MVVISDEIVYASVLISSIVVGLYVKTIQTRWSKQLITSLLGILTVAVICGWETLHSLAAIMGTLIIINSNNRRTPLLAFVFVFSYLLFFRCSALFGLPSPSAVGNAVQLLLSLKLISVAIEIHDFRQKHTESTSTVNPAETRFQLSLDVEPTLYDIACYSYCYIGLFTGPFFKYRTYSDFLHQNCEQASTISWREEVTSRLKQTVVFSLLLYGTSRIFTVSYVKSDEFYEQAYWYRVFYMVPIFFITRMRLYSAWLLAECSCITAALGAYPADSKPKPGNGPTINHKQLNTKQGEYGIKYNFETIHNINPYGSDWSCTVRDGMKNWNMTVQWWLASYVHRKWPVNLKQYRVAAVMSVSAYWHGIAPGYFGAFLTMIFVMFAEDLMRSTVKQRLPEKFHVYYDWANWFFKMRSFEYMQMAFVLLSWQDTYRWWKSTYFIGHLCCFSIISACLLSKKLLKQPKSEKKEQ